jgi:hypothetical protein
MVYRLLADLVVVIHFSFIVFVVVGGLLVWRRPALAWFHLPALAWAVAIITIGFTCPLTPLEKYFRRLGGERGYAGGFVDHYIENVIYPQRLSPVLQGLAAAAIVAGYAGLLRKRQRQRGSRGTRPAHAVTRPDGLR